MSQACAQVMKKAGRRENHNIAFIVGVNPEPLSASTPFPWPASARRRGRLPWKLRRDNIMVNAISGSHQHENDVFPLGTCRRKKTQMQKEELCKHLHCRIGEKDEMAGAAVYLASDALELHHRRRDQHRRRPASGNAV